MTITKWKWTRSGRNGFYGYEIESSGAGKEDVAAAMGLSTALDAVIATEIEDRKKFKEEINSKKAAKKKRSPKISE